MNYLEHKTPNGVDTPVSGVDAKGLSAYCAYNDRTGLDVRLRIDTNKRERAKGALPFEGTLFIGKADLKARLNQARALLKHELRSRLSEARVYNNGSAVSARLAGLGVR